jgi:hypothetical protein
MADLRGECEDSWDRRGKYEDAWDRLRVLERSFHRSFIGAFVAFWVVPLLLAAVDYFFQVPHNVALIYWIPAVLAALVACAWCVRSSWRLGSFRCPRCGNRWAGARLSSLTPGRTCGYCGLFVFQARD